MWTKKAAHMFKQTTTKIVAGVLLTLLVVGLVFLYFSLSNNAPPVKDMSFQLSFAVHLKKDSVLHIWFKAPQNSRAKVSIPSPSSNNPSRSIETNETREFEFHEMHLGLEQGLTSLSWSSLTTIVSYAYVFEYSTVLEEGIRIIYVATAARNSPFLESYHFRPPLGWMNDPNGFSKLNDTYHLFYQHYPHTLKWNAMHWGHATSKDLINWVHLPIFLRPDPAVVYNHKGNGGIFSGSAIPLPHDQGLRLFFTDDISDKEPKIEYQRTVITLDGILPAGPSEVLIPLPPSPSQVQNLTGDFRDPNAFMGPDGKWKMILGSYDGKGGVLLLYSTDDPTGASGWTFLNEIWKDDRLSMTVAECAGMLPIGGGPGDKETLWALVYAQLSSTEENTGKRNLSPLIVGTFDGINFSKLFEKPELDFGTSAYAFQGFYGSGGTVMIAWLANWVDWSDRELDFESAMTLPRQVLLGADKKTVLTPPVETVVTLRDKPLDKTSFLRGQSICLPNGTAEIKLSIDSSYKNNIRLSLVHPILRSPVPGVNISQKGLEIISGAVDEPKQQLIALGVRPKEVRIFIDTGAIEVYADGGETTGTARLLGDQKFSQIQLSGELGAIIGAEVWSLKPAEMRGRYHP